MAQNQFSGVPGFSAAMIRHLQSLRRMQTDHGWIHTLLVRTIVSLIARTTRYSKVCLHKVIFVSRCVMLCRAVSHDSA
jgi:hypothetical protein